jgi:hypothetical protein
MGVDELQHVADALDHFAGAGASTACQPTLEAAGRRSHRFPLWPGQDAKACRKLAGRGHETEPLCDTLHLAIRIGRTILATPLLLKLSDLLPDILDAIDDSLEERAARPSIGIICRAAQMAGQSLWCRLVMQFLENAQAGPGIGCDVHNANALTGCQRAAVAILADLVCDGDLAVRNEQDSPFRNRPALARTTGACLAGTVGEHVGRASRRLRVDL